MKKAAIFGMAILMAAGMARAENVEKTLEINSILADAQSIYLTPAAPARAGRLVALSEYLASLQPTDVLSLRFLCEVDTSRGMFEDAKKYAAKIFDLQPESYQAGCRWLKFELDDRQTAMSRIELLTSIAGNQKYGADFRAHAETLLSALYTAQGDTKKADDSINRALQLDPTSDEALLARLTMTQNPSNELKVTTMLEMLRGNPRNWGVSRDLAAFLNSMGLAEQAAKYYSLAWAVVSNGQGDDKIAPELAVGYFNALLSDSKPNKVVELLAKRINDLKDSTTILELYAEAVKASGAPAEAMLQVVNILQDTYKSNISQIGIKSKIDPIIDQGRKTSPELADAIMQLGAFYLTTASSPELAAKAFDSAKSFGAKGDIVDMLEAAVAMKKGDPKAVEALTKFAPNFAYPNLLLAEYYAKAGDIEKEKKFLTQGLQMGRGTRVSRALRAMWKFPEPLPQAQGYEKVSSILAGFDAQVLYMATHPGDFIKVSVTAQGAPIVSPGQNIMVTVTITNVGQLPVSFGDTGMLSTQVALGVTSPGKTELKFYTAPIVTMPAGKYLTPGKSVSATTRVNAAQIGWYLANDPLKTVQLNIKAFVNPICDSDGYVQSMLPMIQPGAMAFFRAGLLATGKLTSSGSPEVNVSAEWYNRVLGAMNDTLASDNIADRFRTARQIAALMAYNRTIASDTTQLPIELRTAFQLAPIMSLGEKVLQDKSPVVRAEFIAAMNNVPAITPQIINIVGPVFRDPSELVRLRLAEFLGNAGGKGNMEILQMFAADKNPCVSKMAKAFLYEEKKKQEIPSSSGRSGQ